MRDLSILIRSDVETKNTVNVVMPLHGEPIITNQGEEIKVTTIHVAGEIPDMLDCKNIKIYGEEFSGEVNSTLTTQQLAGTPYKTNILVCMGG